MIEISNKTLSNMTDSGTSGSDPITELLFINISVRGSDPGFLDVTHQMEGQPLTLLASRQLLAVTDNGVCVRNLETQQEEEIIADCVILAMGTRTDPAAIAAYEAAFDRVITLGQTHKNPGRIATSMAEGYIAARGFDPLV